MGQAKIRNIKENCIYEKSVNLVNVKIVEDRIANIEILYKTDNEIHNIKAYLKTEHQNYNFDVQTYSFSQEANYNKLTLNIKIDTENIYKFILEDNNQKFEDVEFLDNKDQKINELEIPYKIFTKGFSLTIDDERVHLL